MFEYDKTELSPSPIRGYFRYRVPCGGIVTSVEARGFCGRAANDVWFILLHSVLNEGTGSYNFHVDLLKAECDTSANCSSMFFEGTVRNHSLNIRIPPGGYLAFFSESRLFQGQVFFPASNNQ